MSRLSESLFGCAILLLSAQAVHSAPFAKTNRSAKPSLFQRLYTGLLAGGYRLREMRPGPNAGEWILVGTERSCPEPHLKSNWIVTGPVPAEILAVILRMDEIALSEVVLALIEIARIERQEANFPRGPRLLGLPKVREP